MSNWIAITETRVKTAANTALLSAMQGLASSRSEADPLPELILKAVARIRSAVSGAGNALDSDTTKIPRSLEWLGLNIIVREIKGYLGIELTEAEKEDQRNDNRYLSDVMKDRTRFETPDDADGSSEMNTAQPSIQTVELASTRRATREGLKGL